jgi:hypothetical protein
MCRRIKTLHSFKPPATAEEIRASSLQFVRKFPLAVGAGLIQPTEVNRR